MAKIKKKSNALGRKRFCFLALSFLCLICAAICAYMVYVDLKEFGSSSAETPVFWLKAVAVVVFAFLGKYFRNQRKIVSAGIKGEKETAQLLSKRLPEDYRVFQNINVTFDGKTSEIDTVVVGKSGVFVVEAKNTGGNITADISAQKWHQRKIRGRQIHEKEFYNPVKQVGTHVYRLANFLRENGIRVRVEAAVFIANPETEICFLSERGNIPVYFAKDNGENKLIQYIMDGKSQIDQKTLEKIQRCLNRS